MKICILIMLTFIIFSCGVEYASAAALKFNGGLYSSQPKKPDSGWDGILSNNGPDIYRSQQAADEAAQERMYYIIGTIVIITVIISGTLIYIKKNKRSAKGVEVSEEKEPLIVQRSLTIDQTLEETAAQPVQSSAVEQRTEAPEDQLLKRLEALGRLRDKGILTEEEFNETKRDWPVRDNAS